MGALSDAYRDYPLDLQHIVPLDFSSNIPTLPESHIWTQNDGFSSGFLSDDLFSIPIIDFDDPNAHKLIAQACESWGVFQLTNHGIPMKLIEEVVSETQRLFALPMNQKLKALRSPNGAIGYGVARISPFFSKYMWHEGFTIMGSPLDHAKTLWNHDFEHFCEIMEKCQKEMKLLSEKLMRLIMFKILKISEEEEEVKNWLSSNTNTCSSSTNKNCSTALQLNSYPPCPDPKKTLGLAPHTDTSLITILQQTQTSGLQVFKDGIGWVLVRPISDALVVNVGDFLDVISNGRFHSVLHRVMVNQSKQRFSLAYFYSPPIDFCVSPLLSKCTDSEAEHQLLPLYRTVSVKDYVAIKAKNLNKALSLVKIFQ